MSGEFRNPAEEAAAREMELKNKGTAPVEAEGLRAEGLRAEARNILRTSELLVIEDDLDNLEGIIGRLTEELGGAGNIRQAESLQDVELQLRALAGSWKGGERMVVISDLQIPVESGSVPKESRGIEAINLVRSVVEDWNTSHPEQPPVIADILLNSAMDESEIARLELKVDGRNENAQYDKAEAVEAILRLVEEGLKSET